MKRVWIVVYKAEEDTYVAPFSNEQDAYVEVYRIIKLRRARWEIDPKIPDASLLDSWLRHTRGNENIYVEEKIVNQMIEL